MRLQVSAVQQKHHRRAAHCHLTEQSPIVISTSDLMKGILMSCLTNLNVLHKLVRLYRLCSVLHFYHYNVNHSLHFTASLLIYNRFKS